MKRVQSRSSYRPVEEALKREEDIPLFERCACGGRSKLISAWGYWLPGGQQFSQYIYKCEVCNRESKK